MWILCLPPHFQYVRQGYQGKVYWNTVLLLAAISSRTYTILSPPETTVPLWICPDMKLPNPFRIRLSWLSTAEDGLSKICYCVGLGFVSTTAVLSLPGSKDSFFSQEFWVIIPWICWCWRGRYSRGANLLISLFNFLSVTVFLLKRFSHCVCNFFTFLLGKLNVIFRESISMPRSSEYDVVCQANRSCSLVVTTRSVEELCNSDPEPEYGDFD